jgi:hypothetical protein
MFKIKSKEEKALEEIKKKKEQIDKLKEEINKMGKLVLKDGKLTKVEDIPKSTLSELPSVPPVPIEPDVDAMVQQERLRRQQQAKATLSDNIQMPQQPVRQISQEEYNEMLRRQEAYNYQQQKLMEEEQQEVLRQQQEAYQQQQYRQQPQPYQPVLPMVSVTIEMVTGTLVNVQVSGDKADNFIELLSTAIDNQSSFPINNKVINGRNVVSFTLE